MLSYGVSSKKTQQHFQNQHMENDMYVYVYGLIKITIVIVNKLL